MLAGDQMVMLRKGGIGEKRFDVPHREFVLLPTHVHQRPELLAPEVSRDYPELLAVTEEPPRVDIGAWCQVADVHEVTEQEQLDALAPFHLLGPGYAVQRLKWRPKHPLMAIVARTHRISPPVPLDVDEAMRGCRSWIEVDIPMPAPDPVLDDQAFEERRQAITHALALV